MEPYICSGWFVHVLNLARSYGDVRLDELNACADACDTALILAPASDANLIPRLRSALLHELDVDRNRYVVADHQSSAVHLGVPFHAEILPVDLGSGVRRGPLVAPRIFHRRRRSLHVQHNLFGYSVNSQVPGHFQFAGLYLLDFGRFKSNRRILFDIEKVIAAQILVSLSHARVHGSSINRYVDRGLADVLIIELYRSAHLGECSPHRRNCQVAYPKLCRGMVRIDLPGGSCCGRRQRKRPCKCYGRNCPNLEVAHYFSPLCRVPFSLQTETPCLSPTANYPRHPARIFHQANPPRFSRARPPCARTAAGEARE